MNVLWNNSASLTAFTRQPNLKLVQKKKNFGFLTGNVVLGPTSPWVPKGPRVPKAQGSPQGPWVPKAYGSPRALGPKGLE